MNQATPHVLLRLSILHTGICMDESQSQTIFNAFSQADRSTSREFGGPGLGLAIAKELAELMPGSLTLKSQL
ncbi:hypothetical protein CWB96_23150, partial [Pseudoalteromonas citrea]